MGGRVNHTSQSAKRIRENAERLREKLTALVLLMGDVPQRSAEGREAFSAGDEDEAPGVGPAAEKSRDGAEGLRRGRRTLLLRRHRQSEEPHHGVAARVVGLGFHLTFTDLI